METSMIPTIDLARDSPQRQAELIRHALGTVGFFAVQNAGPAPEDVEVMFEHTKTFFALPMPKKEEYLAGPSGSGYTKLLSQALGEGKRDHKETFSYGKYCAKTTQALPPPFSDSRDAETAIKRFYQACHDVSGRLMELFALALELPKEHFEQSHAFGLNTAMSLIHYPRLEVSERKGLTEMDIRAGAHKDWGTMTLLFQQPNGAPGLQAYLPSPSNPAEFSWYPAPIPPTGGFLVNVGLGMELWSGGNYKATLHRVIFPDEEEEQRRRRADTEIEPLEDRYTLAFFVQPDDDVAFQPILPGGKVDTSFKAITSGELFDQKLKESMNRFKDKGLPVPVSVGY
ncbi:hypothetical protein P7C73_g4834, partial [Tremellales sp. Uapishka_1]